MPDVLDETEVVEEPIPEFQRYPIPLRPMEDVVPTPPVRERGPVYRGTTTPQDDLLNRQRDQWEWMRNIYRTKQIDEANKAVSAAMHTQGVFNMQRDIQSGLNPREAVLKNLPQLIYNRPQVLPSLLKQTQVKAAQEPIQLIPWLNPEGKQIGVQNPKTGAVNPFPKEAVVKPEKPPVADFFERSKYHELDRRAAQLEKDNENELSKPPGKWSEKAKSVGAEISNLKAQMKEIQMKFARPDAVPTMGGASPLVVPPSTQPKASALPETKSSPSPFKEGSTIRNRKDGRLYRVEGGVPVLIEQTPEEQ